MLPLMSSSRTRFNGSSPCEKETIDCGWPSSVTAKSLLGEILDQVVAFGHLDVHAHVRHAGFEGRGRLPGCSRFVAPLSPLLQRPERPEALG